jgi:hypothetical protein
MIHESGAGDFCNFAVDIFETWTGRAGNPTYLPAPPMSFVSSCLRLIKSVELSRRRRRRFSRGTIWQDNCDGANQYSCSNVVALRITFLDSIPEKQLSCQTYPAQFNAFYR